MTLLNPPDPNQDIRPSGLSRIRIAFALFAGALFISCLYTAQRLVAIGFYRPDEPPWPLFVSNFLRLELLAALVPVMHAIAQRLERSRRGLPPFLLKHMLISFLVPFAHLIPTGALRMLVLGQHRVAQIWGTPEWPAFLADTAMNLGTSYFAVDVLTYFAVVTGSMAFRFYRQSRDRELASSRLQSELASARLQALQAQLQPHFLFNTLNTVNFLSLSGNRAGVTQVIEGLSDLLRHSLDAGAQTLAPLEEELHLLARYFEIQRLRFGDRVTLVIDVSPELRPWLVPVMLLQPLVENCIRHAVEETPGPCEVSVRAVRDAETLRIEVRDSGPGFFGSASSTSGRGIGLGNLRARLEHLYGGQAVIETSNLEPRGALVAVLIPRQPRTGA